MSDEQGTSGEPGADRSEVDRVLDEIYGRIGEAAPEPRLDATRLALELLGDPQRAYPVVHLTGTNGKTSTSRITESLLRAHGLRTGLFTSPDLGWLGERIVVDGEPTPPAALIAAWDDVRPVIELADGRLAAEGKPPLTFFEALTVLAFAVFADAPVDVAVVEVGMGGEWDSTNVADGRVAVLTPIDLDHVQRLGSTVAAIARTKSGIVKPGAQVVSAVQAPEALAEIERAVGLSEASLALEGRDFAVLDRSPAVGGQLVDVQGLAGRYERLFVPLLGRHQAQNAAVAIAAVESLLGEGARPLTGDVLEEGLAGATSPGRLQVVSSDPVVVVDAAHNPHGVAAMVAGLAESFRFSRLIAVFAALSDKDAAGMVRAAADAVDEFVVTSAPSARGVDPDELAATVVGVVGPDRVVVEPDVAAALATARDLAAEHEDAGVVVFGSITLIARVLELARDAA